MNGYFRSTVSRNRHGQPRKEIFLGAGGKKLSVDKSKFPFVLSIIFGNTESFQFHRGPHQTPNPHTFLTCQVEPPEDSSKLDNGKPP
ncbi:hypothetical protein TNCT_350601 [Trichonephila clavata]|uniref:Uncharacterized protein n=1 Tax=Trichonephila clavata TaxID=2740835 RepID=A0A8X6FYW4_TRICU|nr:hypothetical protein TNCT_350601 [Trichonephila clavata]